MHDLIRDITNFIFLEDSPEKADIIIVPGGSRPRLMEKAYELYLSGYSSLILPSGGFNGKIKDYESEWEYFRQIGLAEGVNDEHILKEDRAKNTFENARFSWEVITKNNIKIKKALFVCKAHHSRRALMTYKTEFSKDIEFIVIPITDERNITKDNWFLDQDKINVVMKEVEKTGNYFAKFIQNYSKN